MFISSAYAQAAPAAGGSLFDMMFPLIMVFGIIYFLIIRPQNKRQKAHQAMIDALRRGDSVITQGGLVGKVTKVEDDEVQVEIANDTRVTVIRSMIISIRSKTEPVEKK